MSIEIPGMKSANGLKEDEMLIHVKKEVVVTEEDLIDILDTAFYGGITYWCDVVDIKGSAEDSSPETFIKERKIMNFHDMEEDIWYPMTINDLLFGVRMYIEWDKAPYNILDGNGIDTGMVDAEVADCIVQFALFNDVIFG